MATTSTLNVESVYNMARNVGKGASYERRKYTYEYCKKILYELNLSGSDYGIAITKIASILGL